MDEPMKATSDWHDVDLLTREEAIRRLSHEISVITGLQAEQDPDRPGEAEQREQRLAALRRSLAALTAE